MSRLIDKLNKTNRDASPPMGFRTARAGAGEPKILLVASVRLVNTELSTNYPEGADAILLHSASSRLSAKTIKPAIGSLGGIPVGILLDDVRASDTAPLLKTGCDFLVFTTTSPVRAIPQDEDIGKILRIEPSLEDNMVRVINSLPVDAALIAEFYKPGAAMDWRHLMSIQRLGLLLTKPLLAMASPDIAAGELRTLRDAGVKGLVIEADPSRPDIFQEISRVISQLPPRAVKKPSKAEALLPPTGGFQETITPDEEEKEYE
jgi:hypothetical protein